MLTYPPNDHYADILDRAEAEAVASGRGLWRVCGGPDVPLEMTGVPVRTRHPTGTASG